MEWFYIICLIGIVIGVWMWLKSPKPRTAKEKRIIRRDYGIAAVIIVVFVILLWLWLAQMMCDHEHLTEWFCL
jgi:uncharacterized membrane protein